MAFNFNWSPLIADTSRARDMLTTALNKSPKPPIIVDDILVTELNLGSVPPELEILEIGDLAEDRFRGIFKMVYSGDAFLTLKTRVQANPLNTYLSTKPSFASPQPLAASSGLTIPLQITLSDIKLSGFVILVFSRQKGLTLVFRNDPLESLKVSSTFDSIPFVRDYLQKEIEGQLRVLFMEDLPAILHRLSLRLWSPEYSELDDDAVVDSTKSTESTTVPIDPLASPPQNPIDPFNNPLDDTQPSNFYLDPPSETRASFSQKNLLRLAALTDSHHTLSLFTPPIRDAVFRASAGAFDRGDLSGTHTPVALSRTHSSIGSSASSVYSFSDGTESISSRPSLTSYGSAYTGLSMGAGRPRAHAGRKKRTRVVNLRKNKEEENTFGLATDTITQAPGVVASEASKEREDEVVTPPRSPNNKVRFRSRLASIAHEEALPTHVRPSSSGTSFKQSRIDEDFKLDAPPAYRSSPPARPIARAEEKQSSPPPLARPPLHRNQTSHPKSAHRPSPSIPLLRTYSLDKLAPHATSPMPSQQSSYQPFESSGGILEQAWMMKMANEIARKVREEKAREAFRSSGCDAGSSSGGGYGGKDCAWGDREGMQESPPPAYGI